MPRKRKLRPITGEKSVNRNRLRNDVDDRSSRQRGKNGNNCVQILKR